MKHFRLTLFAFVLLALTALPAAAQVKLASVDMNKLFTGFWKYKQATAALENRKTELRKEMKDMADSLEKAQTEYKQLLDQANDPAISPEERDKRKLAAGEKLKDITTSKNEFDQFQRQADVQIQDQTQRMSSNLVTEIQKAVADKARAGGYTMVVNSHNAELISVVYVDPQTDITESVLAQLNAGAPIDLNKPSGAALNISTNLP